MKISIFCSNMERKRKWRSPSLHYAFKFLLVPDRLCPGCLDENFAWNLYWLDSRTGLNYYSFYFDALYGDVIKCFLCFWLDVEGRSVDVASKRYIKCAFVCDNVKNLSSLEWKKKKLSSLSYVNGQFIIKYLVIYHFTGKKAFLNSLLNPHALHLSIILIFQFVTNRLIQGTNQEKSGLSLALNPTIVSILFGGNKF